MDPSLKDRVILETEASLQNLQTLQTGSVKSSATSGTVKRGDKRGGSRPVPVGGSERECRLWTSPRPWSEELLARFWLWS